MRNIIGATKVLTTSLSVILEGKKNNNPTTIQPILMYKWNTSYRTTEVKKKRIKEKRN